MKLHLYFCFSYLAQKPLGKWCNALRLLHPTSFRKSAGVGWLGTMSNKRGDLRPDSSDLLALYRHTLSGAA